jgi:hypothetical protein
MILRLNHMEKREEFNHPILKQRINELKENAPKMIKMVRISKLING